jgi:uncharacterized protein
MRVATHPTLYDPAADVPVLRGTQCTHCSRVYFPPMGIGCEICGADAEKLAPKSLACNGIVFAVAEVHLAPAPFTVVEIVLDDGPLIRGIVHPDSVLPQIGDPVSARWNVVDRDAEGSEVVEPGFLVMPAVAKAHA